MNDTRGSAEISLEGTNRRRHKDSIADEDNQDSSFNPDEQDEDNDVYGDEDGADSASEQLEE